MTATNGALNFGLILSLVCLGVVFVASWYFQSSLDGLQSEMAAQQQDITKQVIEDSAKQRTKIEVQAEMIQQLKETVMEQSKQLMDQHKQLILLQLQLNSNQQQMQNTNGDILDNSTHTHRLVKRDTNAKTLEILRGRDGRDGRDGLQGPRGLAGGPGRKGDIGPTGPPGAAAGGVVYVRWGHNSCPDTGAELVYSGRAGGSLYSHKGGGSDPQCLPLNPNYLKTVSGVQTLGFIYGGEYQHTNGFVPGSHDTDVVCAVCYVPTRNAVYMLPARYTCPVGWTTEYYGYLMSEYYNHHRSTFSCVDHSLIPVIGSSHNHDGFLFYPVEGVCGSLPCPPYDRNKELSCAVCTK